MKKQFSNWTADVINKLFKKQLFISELPDSGSIISKNNHSDIFNQLQFASKSTTTALSITQQNLPPQIFTLDKSEFASDWTINQLETLKSLYEANGPSWTYLSSKLSRKTQTSIKNKIYNGLRRASRMLNQIEGKIYKNTKKTINTDMLLILLDFVFKLQELLSGKGLKINYQAKFFLFRSEILDLSLRLKQEKKEQLVQLVKMIKLLNTKIRSFGIFKTKNRRKWNLSMQGLRRIFSQDNILEQKRKNIQKEDYGLQVQKQDEVMKMPTIEDLSSLIFVDYEREYQREKMIKPRDRIKDLQRQLYSMMYQNESKDQFDDIQKL